MAPNGRPDRRHELGSKGEEVAAAYLSMRGIRVIERRFRRRGGEIDLICRDDCRDGAGRYRSEIVFVEVKARSNLAFGRPEAGLSKSKKRRIRRTAERYLHEHGLSGRYARIDVVSIVFEESLPKSIRHFVNAIGSNDMEDGYDWGERTS